MYVLNMKEVSLEGISHFHASLPPPIHSPPSSTVSVPTAIVTGIRGYPQISTQSTSEQLDDVDQFPLFGRTVPSDVDNAVPIVKFFRFKLNVTHLAVVHVNNGYVLCVLEEWP